MNRSVLGYAEIQQLEVEEFRRCRERERRTSEIVTRNSKNASDELSQQRFVGQLRLTLASIAGPKPKRRSEARIL